MNPRHWVKVEWTEKGEGGFFCQAGEWVLGTCFTWSSLQPWIWTAASPGYQSCKAELREKAGFVFIWSGSGSSILGWITIQPLIQSGSRVLMTKKFCYQKLQFTVPVPRPHKRRPSYRRSLQPSKEDIQHEISELFSIFSIFCVTFLPSWIRIRWTEGIPDTERKGNEHRRLRWIFLPVLSGKWVLGTLSYTKPTSAMNIDNSRSRASFSQRWAQRESRVADPYSFDLDPDPAI